MKKIMSKKILVLCAATTLTCMLPLAASAADKLVVKDSTEVPVFTVDDTGTVLGNKIGMGTTTPQAPLHLNLESVSGVLPSVGTALYSISTGYVMSTQDNSAAFDLTLADGTGIGGYRGTIRGVRARGTLEAPEAAALGDGVLSVLAGVYDGETVRNVGDISFYVDGPVVTGSNPPVKIQMRIKDNLGWHEYFTVKSDGKVGIGDPTPSSKLSVPGLPVYENNTEALAGGLATGAFYRTSTGVLMVCY